MNDVWKRLPGLETAQPGGLTGRLGALARAIRRGYLQMFGIPDYDAYLAHRAARHPGQPVLSRRAFAARAIDRRYGGGKGAKCC